MSCAVSLLVLGASVQSQLLREQHVGVADIDDFGYACANVGDVDSDGIDDFAVGSFGHDVGPLVDAGRVAVFSGATGSLVRVHDGTGAGNYLGLAVAGAGDLDGDGVSDYIASAPYYPTIATALGFVRAYSGATGATLWTRFGTKPAGFFGLSLAGVGDVNGDGKSEVIVGTTADEAWVLGVNGLTVYQLTGLAGSSFGYAVTGCGDLDGDGVNDVAVGIPRADVATLIDLGAVNTYSGATGAYLHTTFGSLHGDQLGRTLARLGDVNGDGVDDIIAGSPAAGPPGTYTGVIQIINGATGQTIREQRGDAVVEYHGQSVAGLGDVNHDGVPDYAVGAIQAGPGMAGRVRVCSGSSGVTIVEWYGVPGPNGDLGSSVAGGDWNGDGVGDVLAGDNRFSDGASNPGSVDVYLMAPAWSANYGSGWPGKNGVPELTALQDPEVGSAFDVQLGNSLGANTTAAFFVGVQTANIPFNFSGTLLVSPLITLLIPVPGAGITLNLSLPDDPAYYFADLYLQVIELDAFASVGRSFTPGLQLHCGFDLP